MTTTAPRIFAGSDYVPARDNVRLTGQLERVFDIMWNGQWWSLRGIAAATGDPEASISAQLRHLRKDRFGGHHIEKRYVGNGLFEYRMKD